MRLSPAEISCLPVAVSLPLSKSVRARELLLDAVHGFEVGAEWDNDDIFVLSSALHDIQLQRGVERDVVLDLHASGTAFRFLTAFCAASAGSYVLFGSARLSERPISALVDVLVGMGAHISYLRAEGHAPLKIVGRVLSGGAVSVDASLSSQFVSALMLVAPLVEGGVDIRSVGPVASSGYVGLTASVISRYEGGVRCSGELDWSSASVWFGAVAVCRGASVRLEGLSLDSAQPDSAVVGVFARLGVSVEEQSGGIRVFNNGGGCVGFLELDASGIPDAVLYLVVAACILNVRFRISGLSSLRLKESDRIAAVISELEKCGYLLAYVGDSLVWSGGRCPSGDCPLLLTHDDHRMAMSLSLFGLVRPVEIDDPSVVGKSYPQFWNDFVKFVNIE